MRSLIVAACLAAVFSMSSNANAASSGQRTNVSYSSSSYSSGSSNSSQMSRAAEQPVPANCIRQECGKLWCWQMGGGKH